MVVPGHLFLNLIFHPQICPQNNNSRAVPFQSLSCPPPPIRPPISQINSAFPLPLPLPSQSQAVAGRPIPPQQQQHFGQQQPGGANSQRRRRRWIINFLPGPAARPLIPSRLSRAGQKRRPTSGSGSFFIGLHRQQAPAILCFFCRPPSIPPVDKAEDREQIKTGIHSLLSTIPASQWK